MHTASSPRLSFADVLDFWLGSAASRHRGRPRAEWFRRDDAFDEAIRERFLPCYELATSTELHAWERTPYAALALVIMLDQFPRNMFRGDPRAFGADAQALAAARRLVERGFDRLYGAAERPFAYLPFEHAEDLVAQRRSLALFDGLRSVPGSASSIDYARRHYDIIARFGRFPHRNAVLGRPSTPEELEFLSRPGSGF
jgi:uncharacterized protein (DUF924 family)